MPISSCSSSRGRRGSSQRRPHSFALTQFCAEQILELKQAFALMDLDGDGLVNADDLKKLFVSLGEEPCDEEIQAMLGDDATTINFTRFATLMGEKLQGTDPEEVILSAFSCLDDGTGLIHPDCLHKMLTELGQRLTPDKATEIVENAPMRDGLIDCRQFARLMKGGLVDVQSKMEG